MKRPPASTLVWLAALAAVVSVGFAATSLPGRFAGDSGLPPPAAPPAPAAAAEAVSLDPIRELAPFGRLVRGEAAPEAAAETTLGLALHGLVIATPPQASSAIVSGPSTPPQVYFVGDTIGPATLVEVVADHIVLDVGGRSETLSFPRAGLPAAASNPETDTGEDAAEDRAAPDLLSGVDALRALVLAGNPDVDREVGDDPAPADPLDTEAAPDDIAAGLEAYRLRLRDDPQAVLGDLGMTATDAGYRVDAEPSRLLRQAGLLPGDILSKVNGQQVGNIADDRQIFDDATTSGHARVELMREGRTVVLSFPLR